MRKIGLLSVFLLLGRSLSLAQDPVPAPTATPAPAAPARSVLIESIDLKAYPRVSFSAKVLEEGRPLAGLGVPDFSVTENQSPYPVSFNPPPPRSFALVVDTSGSMVQNMSTVNGVIKKFIAGMSKDDQVAVIEFSRFVTTLFALGPDKAAARSAADNLVANGESALFDAVFSAAEALKEAPGRRILVLLTDSQDDDGYGKAVSSHTAADALANAKTNKVEVYTIALGEKPDRSLLSKWSLETGGTAQKIDSAGGLEGAYTNVLGALTATYNLAYTTAAASDGLPREVRLTVSDKSASIQYVAPLAKQPVKPVAQNTPAVPPVPRVNDTPPTRPLRPMENATAIEPGNWVTLLPDLNGRVYSLAVIPGQFVRVNINNTSNRPCSVFVYSRESTYGAVKTIGNFGTPLEFFAREDKIFLSSNGGQDCRMGVFLKDYFDAGQKRDAGNGEASALPIKPLEDAFGFLSRRNSDSADMFKVTGLTPGAWKLIVRPSPECVLGVQLLDELGQQSKAEYSKNAGAGVSLPFDPGDAKSLWLRVESIRDARDICGYVIRYGTGDLEVPSQPEVN